jgi:hypothetical protein
MQLCYSQTPIVKKKKVDFNVIYSAIERTQSNFGCHMLSRLKGRQIPISRKGDTCMDNCQIDSLFHFFTPPPSPLTCVVIIKDSRKNESFPRKKKQEGGGGTSIEFGVRFSFFYVVNTTSCDVEGSRDEAKQKIDYFMVILESEARQFTTKVFQVMLQTMTS